MDRTSWDLSWEWVATGQLLLLLTTVLILLMSRTEYLGHFDRRLPGGQEPGLLAVGSVLCLTLLLTQRSKEGITFGLRFDVGFRSLFGLPTQQQRDGSMA